MRLSWKHYDLIANLRADEMIAASTEGDARLKLLRKERESLLDEIASHLREGLPEKRGAA